MGNRLANKRKNTIVSRFRNINNYLQSFTLWGKAKLFVSLAWRYLVFRVETKIHPFAGIELATYDLMRQAIKIGLSPEMKNTEDFRGKIISFEGDYLKGTSLKLREGSSDFFVLAQILVYQEHKPLIETISLNGDNFDDILYIIDAGANVGFTSIYLKKFFPKAKIVAIEPDQGNFKMLNTNLMDNGIEDVYPLRAGLWFKEEDLSLGQGRDQMEWAIFLQSGNSDSNKENTVKGFPLSKIKDMYKFPRVDILKIDIEGGERFLFTNEKDTADLLQNVKYLAIEIHDEFNITQQIKTLIFNQGFSYFTEGETLFAYKKKN
jgi:FkbM family methyltransferase